MNFFNINRGSWIYKRKIFSDTTLIMLEGTGYLATMFAVSAVYIS